MKYYCLIMCLWSAIATAKMDKIVFPNTENSDLLNKDKRVPISGESNCPNNKYYYYPGDQENDWVCDCRPAHVYHPQSDDCFLVYKQGPCIPGFYLILPEKSVIPECVRNPCMTDGYVEFNNNCEKLFTSTPCLGISEEKLKSSILDINATTLQLQCIPSSSAELSIIKVNPNNNCPPGSKRVSEGPCRKHIPTKNNKT